MDFARRPNLEVREKSVYYPSFRQQDAQSLVKVKLFPYYAARLPLDKNRFVVLQIKNLQFII